MRPSPLALRLLLLWILLPMSGCGLSAFQRPQAIMVSSDSLSARDLITYRELSIADFLASDPPPAATRHREHFWAYSCLQLRARDDAPLTTAVVDQDGRAPRYSAAPIDLHYLAYFDRECSWWNPHATLPVSYTLQHEQIHFLITELEARRLNRRAGAITQSATAIAGSSQAAIAAAQLKLREAMQAAVLEMGQQHLAFDKDASNGAHPQRQQQWWLRLSAELAADDLATH